MIKPAPDAGESEEEFSACETDENIEKMLKSVYFTIYTGEEVINFKNTSNYGGNPLVMQDKFFS